MDTYVEFASILNESGLQASSSDLFDTSLDQHFDIPVDAERYGDLASSLCVIC